MSVVKQFITSQASTADYTSDWIPTNGAYEITLDLTIAHTSSPSGNVYVQGTTNGTDVWNIPLDKVRGAVGATAKQFTHTDGDEAIAVSGPSSKVIISVTLVSPPTSVRVFWDGSGGTSTAINGWHLIKRDA